ncbi:serine hydroxymethyltransferase [Parvibaculum sp.]|uniref:serine hydroxymethyltransferase n=1 Tax=Parvibaculum sp. TaxID=2024848 RepID=UPI001D7AD32F|nr:serine hydroxymethyltransferase [Parvibaculum sp.]MBX3490430.1 serine hydroxymethyltransferase [Parvibaculum sp.]MCW5728288.1 serine hydroxymethyltransferase [Parvibaculum sp.]
MTSSPERTRLAQSDNDIFVALKGEEARQRAELELIPSENYAFPEVLTLLGSAFTNKYSEGYPGRRYYGGQEFTDRIENLARERAKALFRAEHANVQPLSGSPMNQAVYLGLLEPGDTILAMDLSHGGHLTHGAPVSHMGRIFNFVRYKTDPSTGAIDFEALRDVARATKPKLVVCGYSSYPRDYDYADFRRVADEVGALTMADVSHIGGLIAADVMRNPLDAGFDVMTTTTHKSMRGPRGGLILCKEKFAKKIDASVFPGLQGGPHMNQVAATATTLRLAAMPAFQDYARQVLANAKALAAALNVRQVKLVTGGTDNHLLVIDTVQSFGLDGAKAEAALDRVGLTVNKQVIPDDPNPPMRPSGVRLGTPAPTTRGMGHAEMEEIAAIIAETLAAGGDAAAETKLAARTHTLTSRFPVPGL